MKILVRTNLEPGDPSYFHRARQPFEEIAAQQLDEVTIATMHSPDAVRNADVLVTQELVQLAVGDIRDRLTALGSRLPATPHRHR